MAPAVPQGLTLISAKGTQLKFWIVQTNEKAEKKVLNVTGTGFNLTVNPREDVMTAPTVDESIRDCQWADLEALGIEWKATVDTGGIFKLLGPPNTHRADDQQPIQQPIQLDSHPTVSMHNRDLEIPSSDPSATRTIGVFEPFHQFWAIRHRQRVAYHFCCQQSAPPHSHPRTESSVVATHQSNPGAAVPAPHEAALLQTFQKSLKVLRNIESGAVKAIRIRYGPDERRGTAIRCGQNTKISSRNESGFTRYSNGILKKRKRDDEDPTLSEDRFQSYRKIVEAKPWCEADLEAERQKEQYHHPTGNLPKASGPLDGVQRILGKSGGR
ncbi:hypothetical protein B0H14DRAFT_3144970 [Mycena olivaceomarginata]|nr:hypothetical protein B0H14DRAFT_3144970 [Mycena olivaceomarginata]